MPIGNWSENKMHGEGFYTYANGDVYNGSFQHGVKHGHGSYYFKVTSGPPQCKGWAAACQSYVLFHNL